MKNRPWSRADEAEIWKVMDHKTGEVTSEDRRKLRRKLDRSHAAINSRINVVRVLHRIPTNLNDREVGKILSFRRPYRKERKVARPAKNEAEQKAKGYKTLKGVVKVAEDFLDDEIKRMGASKQRPIVYDIVYTGDEKVLKAQKDNPCFSIKGNWLKYGASVGKVAAMDVRTFYVLCQNEKYKGLFFFNSGPTGKKEVPQSLWGPKYEQNMGIKKPRTSPQQIPIPIFDTAQSELIANSRLTKQNEETMIGLLRDVVARIDKLEDTIRRDSRGGQTPFPPKV